MLLVILAQTAIIRASKMSFGIKIHRHLAAFGIVAATFVIFDIGSYQNLLKTMMTAIFQHVYFTIFKHNLRVGTAKTG
jgi:hypothetical protein